MLKNVKRALALTAVAPLSVIAMAGSASAATDYAQPTQTGNVLTATCEHPQGGWLVQTIITLEGNGTGSDANDVERVRVRATDNQGLNAYDDNNVKVQKIRVRYFDEDALDNITLNGFPKPVYTKTSDSSATRTGGVKVFNHERDNVGLVEVKVTWFVDHDQETMVCNVPVSQQIFIP